MKSELTRKRPSGDRETAPEAANGTRASIITAVSYTHLTLPTSALV